MTPIYPQIRQGMPLEGSARTGSCPHLSTRSRNPHPYYVQCQFIYSVSRCAHIHCGSGRRANWWNMNLETERLILRRWSPHEFEVFSAMHAEPEIMRFLSRDGQPLTRFQSWQNFCIDFGHWQLRGFGMFAVVERATNELVGYVGPWHPEGWPGLEINWRLRHKFWGRGYATEAARRCVEFAFTDLDRDELISLIDKDNLRSIRVAERLGQKPSEMLSFPHLPGGALVKYRLTKTEWCQSQKDAN